MRESPYTHSNFANGTGAVTNNQNTTSLTATSGTALYGHPVGYHNLYPHRHQCGRNDGDTNGDRDGEFTL